MNVSVSHIKVGDVIKVTIEHLIPGSASGKFSVTGRVQTIREMGTSIVFFTLEGGFTVFSRNGVWEAGSDNRKIKSVEKT